MSARDLASKLGQFGVIGLMAGAVLPFVPGVPDAAALTVTTVGAALTVGSIVAWFKASMDHAYSQLEQQERDLELAYPAAAAPGTVRHHVEEAASRRPPGGKGWDPEDADAPDSDEGQLALLVVLAACAVFLVLASDFPVWAKPFLVLGVLPLASLWAFNHQRKCVWSGTTAGVETFRAVLVRPNGVALLFWPGDDGPPVFAATLRSEWMSALPTTAWCVVRSTAGQHYRPASGSTAALKLLPSVVEITTVGPLRKAGAQERKQLGLSPE